MTSLAGYSLSGAYRDIFLQHQSLDFNSLLDYAIRSIHSIGIHAVHSSNDVADRTQAKNGSVFPWSHPTNLI